MSYLYVVNSQKPTAVHYSVMCSFTGPIDRNLILAKCNVLEIYAYREDGLHLVKELSIFGRIKGLEVFRPSGSSQDLLFLLTERKKFCILLFDPTTQKLVTKTVGSLKERIGRDAEMGQRSFMDPDGRVVGMQIYDSSLKILPLDRANSNDHFNITLEENRVLDMKFLYGQLKPTLIILFEDNRRCRHVRTLIIDVMEKDCIPSWHRDHLEFSAHLLIPVPSPLNGVLVVGMHTITYLNGLTGNIQTVEISPGYITSYTRLDEQGTRYLLSNIYGMLMVVALFVDVTTSNTTAQAASGTSCSSSSVPSMATTITSMKVVNITTDVLGTVTTMVESMQYLDHGMVYLASSLADSQLIKLHSHPIASGNGGNSVIEVLEVYPNIGPIVDMVLVENDKSSSSGSAGGGGPRQLVTCSGYDRFGSLRVIRSGIGIHEQASLEITGIKNIWSIRLDDNSEYDQYLIQSFISETRVLGMEGEELTEIEMPGLSAQESSLYCGNLLQGAFLQVTSTNLRIISCTAPYPLLYQETITSNSGKNITVATANLQQVVITLSGGEVRYYELVIDSNSSNRSSHWLQLMSSIILDQDIACLSLRPVPIESHNHDVMDVDSGSNSSIGNNKSSLLGIGMWTDHTIRLHTLPSLQEVYRHRLDSAIINSDTVNSCSAGGDAASAVVGGDTVAVGSGSGGGSAGSSEVAQARDLLLVDYPADPSTSGAGSSNATKLMIYVGMGDGSLLTFTTATTSNGLPIFIQRRRGILGTHPITFSTFYSTTAATTATGGVAGARGGSQQNKELCVFANCDRPTVIYLRHGKMMFSILDLPKPTSPSSINQPEEAASATTVVNTSSIGTSAMTSFHTELFPDCLAICSEQSLLIGNVADIQKVHIQTIPLEEGPRRIVHIPELNLYAVLTEYTAATGAGVGQGQGGQGEETRCHVQLIEDGSWEKVGSPYELDYLEQGLSLALVYFTPSTGSTAAAGGSAASVGSVPYIVLGTGQIVGDEVEPSRGRIIVLEVTGRQSATTAAATLAGTPGSGGGGGQLGGYCVVCERETKSAVYSLCGILGKLAAGIGNKITIFKLVVKDDLSASAAPGSSSSSSATVRRPTGVAGGSGSSSSMIAELQPECSIAEHFLVLYLTSYQDYLLSGDVHRSISLLRYQPVEGMISEVARDYQAQSMRSILMMGSNNNHQGSSGRPSFYDHYLGCDDYGNLFMAKYKSQLPLLGGTGAASAAADQGGNSGSGNDHKLQIIGEYHLGDYVNVMRRGSLIIQPIDSSNDTTSSSATANNTTMLTDDSSNSAVNHATASYYTPDIFDPNYRSVTGYSPEQASQLSYLYATISGSVGSIFPLTEASYLFFSVVQNALRKCHKPIDGLLHEEDWRAFANDKRAAMSTGGGGGVGAGGGGVASAGSPAKAMIDGDLIEVLLLIADVGDDGDNSLLKEVTRLVNEELTNIFMNANNAAAGAGTGGGGNNSDPSILIQQLMKNKIQLTSEEILRRVEDIARLH